MGMANRAPPQNRDIDMRMMRRNMKVRNVVLSICGAFHRSFIHAILDQQRSKWRSGHERLTYNHVPPRRGHAIVTNANLDSMDMHGAIVTALDIVLPRPNELYWCAAKTFCDRRRLPLHVGIGTGAPAKASARHLSMKRHLLGLQAEDLRDGHLVDGLELRAGPNFRSITIEPDGGIQGFHRGMGEIREFVFCDYPV